MTQDRSAFEQDVHRAWADHLGYPIALASQSGTTILPEAKHAGDKLIALWRIGARTFAQVDPQLADAVRRGWPVVMEIDDHPAMIAAVAGRKLAPDDWPTRKAPSTCAVSPARTRRGTSGRPGCSAGQRNWTAASGS